MYITYICIYAEDIHFTCTPLLMSPTARSPVFCAMFEHTMEESLKVSHHLLVSIMCVYIIIGKYIPCGMVLTKQGSSRMDVHVLQFTHV